MKCEWDGCKEDATSILMLGKQAVRLCNKHHKKMNKEKQRMEKEVDKAVDKISKDFEWMLGI